MLIEFEFSAIDFGNRFLEALQKLYSDFFCCQLSLLIFLPAFDPHPFAWLYLSISTRNPHGFRYPVF